MVNKSTKMSYVCKIITYVKHSCDHAFVSVFATRVDEHEDNNIKPFEKFRGPKHMSLILLMWCPYPMTFSPSWFYHTTKTINVQSTLYKC